MRFTLFGTIVLSALALNALAACHEDTPATEYTDLAEGIGAMASEQNGGDASSFKDVVLAAHGHTPADMTIVSPGKLTGHRGQVDYTYELTCKNASGGDVPDCNGATTAHVKVTMKGKSGNNLHHVELDRKAEWDLSDLDQDTARLTGSSEFHLKLDLDSHADKKPVKYQLDYTGLYTNVLIKSLGQISGGEVAYQIKSKQYETPGSTTFVDDLDFNGSAFYSGDGNCTVTLDDKYKFKITLQTAALSILSGA